MNDWFETRSLPLTLAQLEARKSDDGKMIVAGYAIVYNRETVLYEDERERTVEVILPGAAGPALEGTDQRYLWQHKRDQPLARRSIGTLEVKEDKVGVFVTAQFIDTALGRDAFASVASGLVDGQSFAFWVDREGEKWDIETSGGQTTYRRSITQFRAIEEFSAVTFPQYEETTLQARSVQLALRNRPRPEASGAASAAVLEVYRDARDNLAMLSKLGGSR